MGQPNILIALAFSMFFKIKIENLPLNHMVIRYNMSFGLYLSMPNSTRQHVWVVISVCSSQIYKKRKKNKFDSTAMNVNQKLKIYPTNNNQDEL